MIVVLGATGRVGGKVAEQLLSDGRRLRVVARGKDRLSSWQAKGAEISVGSVEDPAFLCKAFAGADSVLAMIPTSLGAPDIGAYQDKVGESIARALRDSNVKHVVSISSMGAQTEKGTGIVAGLARQEKRLDALPGVNVLHLRAGYFMENLQANAQMIRSMGILGSPIRPDVKIHFIATVDVARHAAGRLAARNFPGKSVQELIGPRDVSMQEAAAILGKAIGKPELPYVQFPYEDSLKAMVGLGMSPSVAGSFVDLHRALNETDLLRAKSRDAGNTTPTSIEDFARTFASAYGS